MYKCSKMKAWEETPEGEVTPRDYYGFEAAKALRKLLGIPEPTYNFQCKNEIIEVKPMVLPGNFWCISDIDIPEDL